MHGATVRRPTSLAWEVRKSSPGKSLSSSAIVPTSLVSRSLTFNSTSQQPASPTVNRSDVYFFYHAHRLTTLADWYLSESAATTLSVV